MGTHKPDLRMLNDPKEVARDKMLAKEIGRETAKETVRLMEKRGLVVERQKIVREDD